MEEERLNIKLDIENDIYDLWEIIKVGNGKWEIADMNYLRDNIDEVMTGAVTEYETGTITLLVEDDDGNEVDIDYENVIETILGELQNHEYGEDFNFKLVNDRIYFSLK